MQQWLKEVARGKKGAKDLTYEETLAVAEQILSGKATDAQIAAYLVAERIKTESPDELCAFIETLEKHANRLTISNELQDKLIDFAGPYNGRNSFAATVPVSLLLADQGIPAFLSASDTLPPKYGTSLKAIMKSLGVDVTLSKEQIEMNIENESFGFVDTEYFCNPLASVRHIREEIGVRTLFNTVEKLINLPQAKNVMLGAFHRTAIHKLNDVFKQLNYRHVYIVQGLEGSEDVPVHRNSFVFDWTPENLESFIIKPNEYGLEYKEFDKSNKLYAEEQAAIIRSILSGESKPEYRYYYNQTLLNAGLRYYLFHHTDSVEEGINIAKRQLRDGNGLSKLESVISNKCEVK
ncbi:anthranilate phosphoribosyltransferase [Gracilibacillus kekensis]|uniref:Anthranilate phosphoribosyltransferase n=1 Tax=Gracilibacillus kekensis TaxID=1027249 RepID=A0A1M7MH78_9BACI|nr:glycosyl transferase [Gracilibacillus kekensis]SHM90215.1 anthranilate phosphoribosyltransferase [Gracilibacillus kekensis]